MGDHRGRLVAVMSDRRHPSRNRRGHAKRARMDAVIAAIKRVEARGDETTSMAVRAETGLPAWQFRDAVAALRADGLVRCTGRSKGRVLTIVSPRGRPAGSRESGPRAAPPKPAWLTERADIDAPPENQADRPAERRCLRCRKPFESWGIGNRLCKACNAYARSAGDADMCVSPPTEWAGA